MKRLALGWLWISFCAAAAPSIVLDGAAPEGDSRFFELPFDVPPGTQEIEILHATLSTGNILDWGLLDPNGFRGYGGGNSENAIVSVQAATRSYLPGPIPAGTWRITVGKAQIHQTPARYHIEITFRTSPTLAPQAQRRPYSPAPPLRLGPAWFAGDFHAHSKESGDARPELDDMATFARGRGLDFVHISDHNTTSQLEFLDDVQQRHPDLLLLPGAEWTSYWGHASAIGATSLVDWRVGFGVSGAQDVVDAYHAQGALFSINHPTLDIGDMCIGCAWKQDVPPNIDGVEITTGGWFESGFLFAQAAIAYWDWICDQGIHAKALGGSDDHRAGVDLSRTSSPIGDPTTMVFARELSADGILEGIRNGRTVVKMQGPADPMIDLTASADQTQQDTYVGLSVRLHAVVTGAVGETFRWVENGVPETAVGIDSDPFVVDRAVVTPSQGERRWRAEVLVDGIPRVVTSHVWVAQGFGRAGPVPEQFGDATLGCDATGGLSMAAALAALVVFVKRRSRRSPRA